MAAGRQKAYEYCTNLTQRVSGHVNLKEDIITAYLVPYWWRLGYFEIENKISCSDAADPNQYKRWFLT